MLLRELSKSCKILRITVQIQPQLFWSPAQTHVANYLLTHPRNAKQCARSALRLVSAVEYEHFIGMYCCLLALAGYPINAHNRACALLSPSPFHNVMAKIVPAMQLTAHAKSSTLCGGPYSVKSNFFRLWVTTILYNYGATLHALCQRGVQKLRKPPLPPPLPYHTPSPLTNSELCVTHLARWIGSLFCKSLIHIIFLTEFSVGSFLFISPNQCRRNGRQANLYARGKVEEQSFTYPHQR